MEWVLDHQQYVPNEAYCYYIHGAARGRALDYPWQDRHGWKRIQDEINGFDQTCQTAAYQGIGWALFIQAAHHPALLKKMLQSITDDTGQSIVKQTLEQIQDSPVRMDSEPLSPWNLDGVTITDLTEAAPEEPEK